MARGGERSDHQAAEPLVGLGLEEHHHVAHDLVEGPAPLTPGVLDHSGVVDCSRVLEEHVDVVEAGGGDGAVEHLGPVLMDRRHPPELVIERIQLAPLHRIDHGGDDLVGIGRQPGRVPVDRLEGGGYARSLY